jgi:hypothetical protein
MVNRRSFIGGVFGSLASLPLFGRLKRDDYEKVNINKIGESTERNIMVSVCCGDSDKNVYLFDVLASDGDVITISDDGPLFMCLPVVSSMDRASIRFFGEPYGKIDAEVTRND